MRLIFIYGPPATGKLTIAQQLAKLTGFSLYHNHLAVDLVESIFDREKFSHFFFSTIAEVNLFMLSKAVQKNVPGIIMTSCYIHPDEDTFIEELISTITKYNGEIDFVQVLCDEDELMKRVSEESRKKFGKLRDPKKLLCFLREKNLTHKINSTHSLSINNTKISAKAVAYKIKDHFQL